MPPRTASQLRGVIDRLRRAIGDARGRRALALLDAAAVDLPEAVLLADDRSRYVWANDAAARLLGHSKMTLLQMSVLDITPPDAEADVDILWRTFLSSRYQCGTYPVRRPSGRRTWLHYFAEPRLLPGLHVSVLKPARRVVSARR